MTILSKYIDPATKTIFVGKEDWKAMNDEHGSDKIKADLIEEILAGNIKFPHNEITIEDARDSFKKLVDYKCKDFQYGPTMTRYDYRYPIGDKYLAETLVGNDASNFFHQEARSWASGHNDPCPQDVWRSAHYLNSSLKGIWTLKMEKLDLKSIRSSMALRKYWASQFRPAMAKSIYEKFNSVDVLDFSSGWGDRLCGFYSCKNTRSYIGIDPNKAVYDQYFKQVDLYKPIMPGKQTTFYNMPAEDVKLDANIVDTVFTSPPYFCAETYTQDDTQSWVRYKEVDSWLEGFMYPTLNMVWKALKPGGHLIVNISDVHRKNQVCHICDPMNDYIKDKLGGVLVDTFGMKLSKRPASAAYNGKTGTCVEPIWAWVKPSGIINIPDDGNERKEIHVTSVWREDSNTGSKPRIEILERPVNQTEGSVEEPRPGLKPFELIVDSMEGIDPRALGKLMIELGNKVDLTVVHGDMNLQTTPDIVYKLCEGLDVKWTNLRETDGTLKENYIGKKKMVTCQAGQKPEFAIMEE